jgi:hypothetical protein
MNSSLQLFERGPQFRPVAIFYGAIGLTSPRGLANGGELSWERVSGHIHLQRVVSEV